MDVEPEVNLKKYKGLKVSFEQKSAGDDELNAEMNTLIGMHATYETADREAKTDDIVRFNSKATIDNEAFDLWSRENLATRIGVNNYGEAFDSELLGVKRVLKNRLLWITMIILRHLK